MFLAGKRALVTGSTSGIGLAIARALAAEGAQVTLNGFGAAEEIDRLCGELGATYAAGDLTTTERYRTVKDWDQFTGYGRMNAYEATRLVKSKRIPPEADLLTPTWFSVLGTSGSMSVTGTVNARFAETYDYRIEWAPGVQPPQYPATDTWRVAKQETGLTGARNVSTSIDLATVAAALPNGGVGPSDGALVSEPFGS